MKFLVVDDSATMRRIIINSLMRIGYTEFVEAENGRDALKKLDGSIGFITIDETMPGMTGIECAEAIRQNVSKIVPILMVVLRSQDTSILAKYREAGANGYIEKPFTPQVLREKIEAIMHPFGV